MLSIIKMSFFQGPSGVISSPNFPEIYPKNTKCYYNIEVEETQVILRNYLMKQGT